MLITIHLVDKSAKDIGLVKTEVVPRVGEFINVDDKTYSVVQVRF
jgi:hypothetical protein